MRSVSRCRDSRDLAVDAAMEACQRLAAVVLFRMTRGVWGLSAIAAGAPLLGVLAAVDGIVRSFQGCNGSAEYCRATLFFFLSRAPMPVAISLAVAIPALWFYRSLLEMAEQLAREMRCQSWQLANQLRRLPSSASKTGA